MRSLLWQTSALAVLLLGCATGKPATPEAELTRTVTSLRAQNTAYTRKIEELENQVFVLQAELDSRRAGSPAAPEPAPPPALPETKLKPGQETPQPADTADRPLSMVDDAAVEYAEAAAEQRSGKRPLLRLWGPGTGEPAGEILEARPERPRAHAASARLEGDEEAALKNADTSEAALYQYGLEQLRTEHTSEAIEAFRAFLKRYPSHEFADNAQYWLGECYYHRKDYSMALREFRRVVEKYSRGNKVPDAMLKLGYCYLALGSVRPGCEALAELTRNYPRHPASGLAAAKLAETAAVSGSTECKAVHSPKEVH
jgi:tol-pal system protein YbgF